MEARQIRQSRREELDSEMKSAGCSQLSVSSLESIFTFQVAMNDPIFVQECKGYKNFSEDETDVEFRQRLCPTLSCVSNVSESRETHQSPDAASFCILHYDPHSRPFSPTPVVLDDIGYTLSAATLFTLTKHELLK
jgi:hypothetical protein